MLTGKAKEDFEIWYLKMLRSKPEIQDRYWDENLLSFFWNSDDTMRNAYIVEFFESVEIFIHATTVHPIDIYGWGYNLCDKDDIMKDYTIFKTKQEAVKVMFEKSNEIYNKRVASI